MGTINQKKLKQHVVVEGKAFHYYSLPALQDAHPTLSKLPYSLKILLENVIRKSPNDAALAADLKAFTDWIAKRTSSYELMFSPARVLMQDFTGVPAVVDLAAMRDAMVKLGGDPASITPLTPVDLVIDHSVMVDQFGSGHAFGDNVALEYERNKERYAFLRWGQKAFDNFRVVPPGTGICHQVNLEYLAQVVWHAKEDGECIAYPDTLVGTDSHTTMINGLAVLGWGVGGIEAEAAMLGQPLSMILPDVIGFKLVGKLNDGITATDLVLTVTNILRTKGVVGKFVEFYGAGLNHLPLADRATIANMAPEYGATCGYFPIDQETTNYLTFSGRAPEQVALVEAYAKAQNMWRYDDSADPVFTDTITLDLSTIEPTLAGPKRPQDKVLLSGVASECRALLTKENKDAKATYSVEGADFTLQHGNVVIAAITSCTNTSNPSVMMAAGLLARKAIAKGLTVKPWVKTSLAPGSQIVTDYLNAADLQKDLDTLGFNLVGYGCTTCIGNSGPLPDHIAKTVEGNDLSVAAVLSGNRNFEGRIHPQVKLSYLASPPLVVAYALAGSTTLDLATEPLGTGSDGAPVYLKDIWPTTAEIQATLKEFLTPAMFAKRYAEVFKGDALWQALPSTTSTTYDWDGDSTYIKNPPYFHGMPDVPGALSDIKDANILALLGDSITTDHISPAGSIKTKGPAGEYLQQHGVSVADFNSYGARRGNHEIMMRGTFANIRLQNEMTPDVSGGYTRFIPTGEVESIYDAAMKYAAVATPLVIFAGKEYGTGSSRDWAAKGTKLLGVKAVIAESFERIHRSNLVGMGILPLLYPAGTNRRTLHLDGSEVISIQGIEGELSPGMSLQCTIKRISGTSDVVTLICGIATNDEVAYFKHGGILPFVLRQMAGVHKPAKQVAGC